MHPFTHSCIKIGENIGVQEKIIYTYKSKHENNKMLFKHFQKGK